MNKVSFVGAGPGDPELITVKGLRLLKDADLIIYAGSLINPELLKDTKAELYDSSKLHLEETVEIIKSAVAQGKKVVRLHSGDPSIYGAISEQIERLRELGIEYEIVPGVSSAFAGAAFLGQELTIPEVSQTVIFTRVKGRTPVPEAESLSSLARHRATMVIFLSASLAEEVQAQLLEGYPADTPVAVVERVTWPQQRVFRCRLLELSQTIKAHGITKTALIYVGDALKAGLAQTYKRSKLYDRSFSHGHRP
jgi:precorrin-4/cobalt-precorrin-4 C11-methyltransferase